MRGPIAKAADDDEDAGADAIHFFSLRWIFW